MNVPPAVLAFADLAARYCAEIEAAPGVPRAAFLLRLHALLPALYAAALALPSAELESDDDAEFDEAAEDAARAAQDAREADDRMPHEAWLVRYQAVAEAVGEPGNHYAVMFDPYDLSATEPTVGSLADDLADTYRDLGDGLAKWRRGEWERAAWTWRFHFTIHWGEHVLGALRALHALAERDGPRFPGDRVADV